jgi:phosphoserine aminotransferase
MRTPILNHQVMKDQKKNQVSNHVYNFAPGPAMLPSEVMRQAQEEFLNWKDTGISAMEISHRSKEYIAMAEESDQDLRNIMSIPDNYKILFLQGGATSQFAGVPMNLLGEGQVADYIHTGQWSAKAIKEAKRHGQVNVAATSKDQNFMTIPDRETWKLTENAAYVYYCSNETIGGLEFQETPDVGNVPLVCDLTSHALSRPIDVSRYGVIIAGSQKNIGPSGLVIVIVRDDLIGEESTSHIPRLMDYAHMAATDSMSNTPATYSWYMAGLVFKWIIKMGGLEAMEKRAISRSEKLYSAIDNSDFYSNPVDIRYRSRMNVPFTLADDSLDGKFLQGCEAVGLVALKGHRDVGGMRASIYNAMPEEGVDALIDFMNDFEKENG